MRACPKWANNFKSNLALVVSYHPFKFQIDWTKRLPVRVRKPKYFGWVQAQNGQIDRHQFQKQLSLRFEQRVFELESGNQSISDERTPKIGKWTDPNFRSNQALEVSYHPVKIQVDWKKRLRVRVWKKKYFGWAHAQSRQTEGPQFWKQPNSGSVLLPC